ncbi:MAG: LptF/LptG family permease [Epsilonproteobacteria bacterium]|nr:LptF/LptG family permease [Campylobacterota bacterium]
MSRLSKYLNNQIFKSFLSFFIPLFGIASLIFFIKLVSVTSIIKVSFLELFQMYLFILPQILFFTLPITFFAAGVAGLYRLSFEYETIAFFSLGVSPAKIASILGKTAFWLTLVLLLFSLVLIPQAKQIYKGFIAIKRAQAKLNIKSSEFGHSFGDWYLYLGEKSDGAYTNVALYNNKLQNQENFIVAQKAILSNDGSGFRLVLYQGHVYTYQPDNLREIWFDSMELYDTKSGRSFYYVNPLEYWLRAIGDRKRAFDLSLFLLIALFPLASVFFIATLGIAHPRFDNRSPFLLSLTLISIYFGIAFAVAKSLLVLSVVFAIGWFFVGFLLFYFLTLRRY